MMKMHDLARRMQGVKEYLGLLVVLAALLVFFGFCARNFFSRINLLTIANQVTDITIISVGMTFVLIIAGIDLSVGSVMALCGGLLGMCLVRWQLPLAVGVGACLGAGCLCGLLNGLVTIRWNLPSFIVTLGMMQVARGACQRIMNSETLYIGGSVAVLAETKVAGVPLPIVLALAAVILGQVTLSRTVFGRYLIAIGTNEQAVRLSGIDPRPIKLAVFILCSGLTGLAAVIHTARAEAATPIAGEGLELEAIAAVVIGGTSLMGGRGSVISSFFGVLIIAVLSAGLVQMGAKDPTKQIIIGSVIVAAVILDHYRQRLREFSRREKG
ncbi:MAG: ABC transporter permease [Sedimentisphaerales bacterium]|nr:ABC transporter permease [Sedimentisphaerales bacterium]